MSLRQASGIACPAGPASRALSLSSLCGNCMASARSLRAKAPTPAGGTTAAAKATTGILGFDQITGGGLPRGRTTLLVGGPGSGKTIFSLQFLVHGARLHDEPGIFVGFEETARRIVTNAASFGWGLTELQPGRLLFIDAQPAADQVQSGDFDLGGMLAVLEVRAG